MSSTSWQVLLGRSLWLGSLLSLSVQAPASASEVIVAATQPGRADAAPTALRVVKAMIGGTVVEVAIDPTSSIKLGSVPHEMFLAAGAMAVPLSLMNPFYGFGVLYPVVGPPLNAAYNAKRTALIQAADAVPLPEAIVTAMRDQLPGTGAPSASRLELHIARYGLATRSGKDDDLAQIFRYGEDLCLTVLSQLTVTVSAGPRRPILLCVGPACQGSESPPPMCASLSRFADEDGVLLRQAIGELAEILAAMAVSNLRGSP